MATLLKDICLFFLLGLAFPPVLGAGEQPEPVGFWEGTLIYRGAELQVRLAFEIEGRALTATLDIPSLVYVDQEISVRAGEDGTYVLEFPFGIGALEIKLDKRGSWHTRGEGVQLSLIQGSPPPYRKVDITFGPLGPALGGTVFIPEGEGPFPAVVLIAGSGNANRQQWSYASWADFYARAGIAAFIYDRRPEMLLLEGGGMMGMEDHARDVADAINKLKKLPEINPKKIGVASHSRGGWIAMALGNQVPDLAFMVFLSPVPVTPAEQNIDSKLTGMDQDGLSPEELEAARNYFRLYFYVAETGQGWDLLEPVIKEAQETTWGQYVDQPRRLEDLKWWKANMNFAAAQNLRGLKMPVLALWGGADFITPYIKYQGIFRQNLEMGGNENITTLVFPEADHRIEVDPGTDSDGNWHWFGLAPGSLKAISEWVWEII